MPFTDITQFLEQELYGNPTSSWLIALAVFAVATFAVLIGKSVLVRRFSDKAQKTETEVDDLIVDLIRKTNILFYGTLILHAASTALVLSATVQSRFKLVVMFAVLIQVIVWINTIVKFFEMQFIARHANGSKNSVATVRAFGFGVRLLLFVILLLVTLQNLNIDITTLITGLGIGGIAIALAVQNILGDLFAALSITVDKPFLIGDTIAVDTFQGTVEHIGLKTTRLRSLTGEQIIFSNGDLLKSRIKNFRRMYERQISFKLSVNYNTDRTVLEQVPTVLQEIITALPNTRFNRSHLSMVNGSSLDFETVYHVTTPDYMVYMNTQQAINLAVLRRFDALKISLASSGPSSQILQAAAQNPRETPIVSS